ncbi:MAG: hypothetical protein EBR92_06520 [Alphaproteobacteria bacterium]|nr:hypothetical protein [Alphaproteobacteria bacterium]
MEKDNSLKSGMATAPETEQPSAVVRHLGLIKAMSIIMAVLIIAALVVIVTTIYSRLTNSKTIKAITENTLVIPAGTHISAASGTDKGGLVVVIDGKTGQAIWQLDAAGKVIRKTSIVAGD